MATIPRPLDVAARSKVPNMSLKDTRGFSRLRSPENATGVFWLVSNPVEPESQLRSKFIMQPMPPFGKESSEPSARSLPFLSLSGHAAPKKVQRRPPSKAFAPEKAEPAESVSKKVKGTQHKRSLQLPFQDEEDECCQPSSKSQRVPVVLFCDEPAEDGGTGKSSGSDGGDQSDVEDAFEIKSSSEFALGWKSVLNLKQSTFWKENQDDHTGAKPKRAYDNSKRGANAMYIRKDSGGSFKKSGADPQRLESLFKNPSCRCAMDFCYHTHFLFLRC